MNDNVNRFVNKINGHHETTIYRLINQNTWCPYRYTAHIDMMGRQLKIKYLILIVIIIIYQRIEYQLNRKSIQTFYNHYNRYNIECMDIDTIMC